MCAKSNKQRSDNQLNNRPYIQYHVPNLIIVAENKDNEIIFEYLRTPGKLKYISQLIIAHPNYEMIWVPLMQILQVSKISTLKLEYPNYTGLPREIQINNRCLKWCESCHSFRIDVGNELGQDRCVECYFRSLHIEGSNRIKKNSQGEIELIDLFNTKITTLPKSISRCLSLSVLSLCDTNISILPDWIENFKDLTRLSLCKSDIKLLPLSLCNCKSLNILDLRETGILTLPENFFELLESSNFNMFYWIKDKNCIEKDSNSHVTRLDLSDIKIKILPDWIQKLNALEILDLSNTEIENIPDWLCNCHSLTSLYIYGSKIRSLPDSFFNLIQSPNFTLFSCSCSNNIEKDSKGQLIRINFQRDQLNECPEWIGKCSALKELDCRWTSITTIPESIGNCSSLTTIDLAISKISSLPDSIGKCKALTSLKIYQTEIRIIPENINQCRLLKDFEFGSCLIPDPLQKLLSTQSGRDIYAEYPSYLSEKISKNIPLDECDFEYPFYMKYRDLLEKVCNAYPTQTSNEIRKIFEGYDKSSCSKFRIII